MTITYKVLQRDGIEKDFSDILDAQKLFFAEIICPKDKLNGPYLPQLYQVWNGIKIARYSSVWEHIAVDYSLSK